MAEDRAYGGLVGAYPYAFRQSDSVVFRSYVVASALVGLYVSLLLVLGVIAWFASRVLVGEKAFLGVIGILVLGPLSVPVLVVARRYRLNIDRPETDWALGLAGYAFVAALYVGLFVTDPADHALGGPVQPVVAVLDSLQPIYGLVPPVLAAGVIYLVVRRTRPTSDS